MMSVFKVRDAFLALTYEQQAMIVDDWMERTPIATVMVSSAPKVAATEQTPEPKEPRYIHMRDGLPYDERESEACDTLILQSYTNTEVAKWFSRYRPSQRTFGAWKTFADRRRKHLTAKGQLK
jgi:hypothetical protein